MLTLGAGLILFLMFVVYRGAMGGLCPDRPVNRGRISRQAAGTEAELYLSSEDQKTRKALKYLPNTWVPKAAHCMETVDGRTYCYFQEWVKESPTVIKFTPFAMISTRKGDKPDDPPYTVLSDKAYVTFKGEFGPLGKNPGPVVSAGLEGNVVITGPNNVVVHGRNFFFQREEMRIYSDNPVDIQADKHHATAKGIQIELVAEHPGHSDEALSISGVSSVKLPAKRRHDAGLQRRLPGRPAAGRGKIERQNSEDRPHRTATAASCSTSNRRMARSSPQRPHPRIASRQV